MKKTKKHFLKLAGVLCLGFLLSIPSISYGASPEIKKIQPNKAERGQTRIIKISGRNFGNVGFIEMYPRGKRKGEYIYGYITGQTESMITATVYTSQCYDPPGRYDVYLYKSESEKLSISSEGTTQKPLAKKSNAFLLRRGKKEPKISRVSPNRAGKGGKSTVRIKGKNLDQITSVSIYKYKEGKKGEEGEYIGGIFTTFIKSTNSKVTVDASVITDTVLGKRDVILYGHDSEKSVESCAEKKNGFRVLKNKLKGKNITPSTAITGEQTNFSISGTHLKNAYSVEFTMGAFPEYTIPKHDFTKNNGSTINFPNVFTDVLPLGTYDVVIYGQNGRDILPNAVVVTETISSRK